MLSTNDDTFQGRANRAVYDTVIGLRRVLRQNGAREHDMNAAERSVRAFNSGAGREERRCEMRTGARAAGAIVVRSSGMGEGADRVGLAAQPFVPSV